MINQTSSRHALDSMRLLSTLFSLAWFIRPVARDLFMDGYIVHGGWNDAWSIGDGVVTAPFALSGLLWAFAFLLARGGWARISLALLSVASTFATFGLLAVARTCFFGQCPEILPAWYIWS